MGKGSITVIGLGPGRAGLITRESWEIMKGAEQLFLRTEIHPCVEALCEAGLTFHSYDALYEKAGSFAELYSSIVEDLIHRAEDGNDIVYAVPGSPFVAERTVSLLRARMDPEGLEILPAMSFVEVLYSSLGIDPIDGLVIMDAETMEERKIPVDFSLVVTQVYDQRVASATKLQLMEQYQDEYEIVYVHHLSLEDEKICRIPIYELDRQPDIDHLTSVFIPSDSERQ